MMDKFLDWIINTDNDAKLAVRVIMFYVVIMGMLAAVIMGFVYLFAWSDLAGWIGVALVLLPILIWTFKD